jgi:mono/diheme cytochrome c family protein
MRCLTKLPHLLPGIILLYCFNSFAQGPKYHLGKPATPDEIKGLDIFIGPHGENLPPGSGTVKQGQQIFTQKCALCHGPNGEGGPKGVISDPYQDGPRLVGGIGTLTDKKSVRTIGSFWSSAPAIWEFIKRGMPQNASGSLTPDQVYAVLAFLLNRNGIIKEDMVLDAKTLPTVQMPNRDGFIPAKPVYPEPGIPKDRSEYRGQ